MKDTTEDTNAPTEDDDVDLHSGVPEIIRRFAALGLTGFFTTESALRKALGDTLPKDWIDFAAEQSEKTRHELLDRIAAEFGKILQGVELDQLIAQILDGRTVELKAEIRLKDEPSE